MGHEVVRVLPILKASLQTLLDLGYPQFTAEDFYDVVRCDSEPRNDMDFF